MIPILCYNVLANKKVIHRQLPKLTGHVKDFVHDDGTSNCTG